MRVKGFLNVRMIDVRMGNDLHAGCHRNVSPPWGFLIFALMTIDKIYSRILKPQGGGTPQGRSQACTKMAFGQ